MKPYLLSETQRRAGAMLGSILGAECLDSVDANRGVFDFGGQKFTVRTAASGGAAAVLQAAMAVRAAGEGIDCTPVVAVPFMGETGRRICDEHGVCWIDLSGNARIIRPGLRVIIDGRPNQFKRVGRPGTVFAPKSSRIARRLLIEPGRTFSQRELARETGLDEGFTSRIVRGLHAQGLIARDESDRVKVADFALLLDAWREVCDFSKHNIVRFHLPSRSGDAAVQALSGWLAETGIRCAATGMAAAWLMDHFADFRLAVFYVDRLPSGDLRHKQGLREVEQGENVWLVVPNDKGVFDGAGKYEGVHCVHPVQIYLDLKGHPERASEAAERLRKELLKRDD